MHVASELSRTSPDIDLSDYECAEIQEITDLCVSVEKTLL